MIKIIDSIDTTKKDIIVSQYISHIEYYTGHIIVINSQIVKQIYFKATTNDSQYIQKGRIENYQILTEDQLNCSTTIFNNIFKKLNYTVFASIDFIIHDSQILIFEINPRVGGSLIYNVELCNEFLNYVFDYYDGK